MARVFRRSRTERKHRRIAHNLQREGNRAQRSGNRIAAVVGVLTLGLGLFAVVAERSPESAGALPIDAALNYDIEAWEGWILLPRDSASELIELHDWCGPPSADTIEKLLLAGAIPPLESGDLRVSSQVEYEVPIDLEVSITESAIDLEMYVVPTPAFPCERPVGVENRGRDGILTFGLDESPEMAVPTGELDEDMQRVFVVHGLSDLLLSVPGESRLEVLISPQTDGLGCSFVRYNVTPTISETKRRSVITPDIVGYTGSFRSTPDDLGPWLQPVHCREAGVFHEE